MSKFNGNALTWFEIPTTDMARARGFYEAMLDAKLIEYPGAEPCFIFPHEGGSVSGALVTRAGQEPSGQGTTVYLNVDGKLDASLERAQAAGAKVVVPRTQIPGGFGFYACMIDSEGNHVGLHSR